MSYSSQCRLKPISSSLHWYLLNIMGILSPHLMAQKVRRRDKRQAFFCLQSKRSSSQAMNQMEGQVYMVENLEP